MPIRKTVDSAFVALHNACMGTDSTLHEEHAFFAPIQATPLPPRSSRRFARDAAAPATTGEPVQARDGRQLWLRPIAGNDVDAIRRCFTRLSSDEVRMRFLHNLSELPEAAARRLCEIDPEHEAAFVLMDTHGKTAEMRGVARVYIDDATASAEFAVLVERAWTGLGLGALLMQRLVDECRRRGLAELWGYVLMENRPMLDLCRELGFKRRPLAGDPGTALIALDLAQAGSADGK
jgi:acetyltransferase